MHCINNYHLPRMSANFHRQNINPAKYQGFSQVKSAPSRDITLPHLSPPMLLSDWFRENRFLPGKRKPSVHLASGYLRRDGGLKLQWLGGKDTKQIFSASQ